MRLLRARLTHVHTFSDQNSLWTTGEITHMTSKGYSIRNNYYVASLP